jgi:hypothetical protein
MNKDIAFIVGNGVSRKEIDLNSLVGKGAIFGCNALYRDFDQWDFLVAIDDGMIAELLQKDFSPKTLIVPPVSERFESAEYNPGYRRRSNAGMNAMLEAIRRDYKFLYCLGFDFLLEGEVSVDNLYKDTPNYGIETRTRIEDNYHRIRYLEWFAEQNPLTTFIFVLPKGAKTKIVKSENILGMTIPTFKEKLEKA